MHISVYLLDKQINESICFKKHELTKVLSFFTLAVFRKYIDTVADILVPVLDVREEQPGCHADSVKEQRLICR